MINRNKVLTAALVLSMTISQAAPALAAQQNIVKSALPVDTAVAGIALDISNYGVANSDSAVDKVLATATNDEEESAEESSTAAETEASKKKSTSTKKKSTSTKKKSTKKTDNSKLLTTKVSSNLNVRENPSKSAEIIGKLFRGNKATILKEKGKWYKIKSGHVTGWVSKEYAITGDKAAAYIEKLGAKTATVTGGVVNVRKSASMDADVLLKVKVGGSFKVLKVTDDWIKIKVTPDYSGWISADYVDVETKPCSAMLVKKITMLTNRITRLEKKRERAAAKAAAAESSSGSSGSSGSSSSSSSGSSGSSTGSSSSSYSSTGAAIAAKAQQYAGWLPYIWGGSSLSSGADCSGFVMALYSIYGISMPHNAASQASCCRSISYSELQPGDLVFYGSGGISHVAIYIGGGMICHEANPSRDCSIDSVTYCGSPVKYGTVLH